jgi:hypothetical protein
VIYSIEDKPFGLTWANWTSKWWRWLLSIPKEKNPILGNIEDNFYFSQGMMDVIFLAGTLGGLAERRCTIPFGKPILFPIINFITSYVEEPNLKSESELITRAKKDMDDIVKKEAVIDGVKVQDVEKYRIQSSVFDLRYPENNVFELAALPTKAISDGYWVFLKPLSAGLHNIHAVGSCSSGKTTVDVTWHLDVKDSLTD